MLYKLIRYKKTDRFVRSVLYGKDKVVLPLVGWLFQPTSAPKVPCDLAVWIVSILTTSGGAMQHCGGT